ncbi:MAG TPA: nucleotidyltransferase family protein [Rhizomicrobium sp.]|nr:nucleotidyltransferase family protein [Rhizomicrobium sp.]
MRKVTRAMIMAAGFGTRMRPLTDHIPKPLVTVRGKSLLDHTLDRLVAAGVTMVVINLHYRGAQVQDHLAKRRDIEIRYSLEEEILGTGGGVVKALPHFEGESFFVLNSDSVWVEGYVSPLTAMQRIWEPERMDGLLLLASMITAMGYEGRGDFLLDVNGRVSRVPELTSSPFAYTGVQIVHPRLFTAAPAGNFSTNRMWDLAIAKGRLFGIRLEGVWIHVGTPDAREDAERYLARLMPA